MNKKPLLIRIFIAIKIYPDDYFRSVLKQIKDTLRSEPVRWVKDENLHITIRFIGDFPESDLDSISKSISSVAMGIRSFEIAIKGLGVYRSISHPRVLWSGIEDSAELHQLAQSIDKALVSVGFKFDTDNFSPHLTLGRMKRIMDTDCLHNLMLEYSDSVFLKQSVESVILYQSILKDDGPEYLPLIEHFFV